MPRKAQPWFRFYVETITDAKVRKLTPPQRWVWAAVMAAARQSPVPGVLLVTETVPMDVDDLASFCDVKVREVQSGIDKMTALGMVAIDAAGVIRVCNFSSRQFLSDDVTARTKKHRERSNDTPLERSNDAGSNDSHTEGQRSTRGNSSSDSGSPNAPAGSVARIVKAYVESAKAAGIPTPEASQDRVSRSARSLIAQDFPLDAVEDAARNAAVQGWTDLSTQMQRDAARSTPESGLRLATTDQRFKDANDLAAALEADERKAIG